MCFEAKLLLPSGVVATYHCVEAVNYDCCNGGLQALRYSWLDKDCQAKGLAPVFTATIPLSPEDFPPRLDEINLQKVEELVEKLT